MNMEGVKNGRYADLYSPVRAFSAEERAKVQEQMQATYDTFVEKAAAGRNTTPERIDAMPRAASGPARRPRPLGWWTSWRPRTRARGRQAARQAPPGSDATRGVRAAASAVDALRGAERVLTTS